MPVPAINELRAAFDTPFMELGQDARADAGVVDERARDPAAARAAVASCLDERVKQ